MHIRYDGFNFPFGIQITMHTPVTTGLFKETGLGGQAFMFPQQGGLPDRKLPTVVCLTPDDFDFHLSLSHTHKQKSTFFLETKEEEAELRNSSRFKTRKVAWNYLIHTTTTTSSSPFTSQFMAKVPLRTAGSCSCDSF